MTKSVTITNTSNWKGEGIVLEITAKVGKGMPLSQYEKVYLGPGESKIVGLVSKTQTIRVFDNEIDAKPFENGKHPKVRVDWE